MYNNPEPGPLNLYHPADFSQRLLSWHAEHGRHDLPWQHPRTPYRVWISEIMLQQTQVQTVIPYFQRFMQAFADIHSLTLAPLDRVLHLWTGLGYYARARNLHKAAMQINTQHNGNFPTDFDEVIALPGIGRSTAGAILAQAFGQPFAILDGNVKRLFTRLYAIEGWPGTRDTENRLWKIATSLTPHTDTANYTQAIMDLGATLCRRSNPACPTCPFINDCRSFAQGSPTAYPTPKPRKQLPIRITRMLLMVNQNHHCLLEQRPAHGIWGSLWCLPEVPEHESLQPFCQQYFGFAVEHLSTLPILKHSFSHFHLHIEPLVLHIRMESGTHAPPQIMESSPRVWYNIAQPDQRGLPAPVVKLLEQLKDITL